jgi:type VI secretion system protein ImpK
VDAIYWASAEVLIAATRLGADLPLPAPEVLRQELLGQLQGMVLRCRQAGIPDKETAEARYAIVAFIDERILRSNWPGRVEWMNKPLQLQLYNEFTAGENFFNRLQILLQSERESPALEVYYLCLALGFVGAAGAAHQVQSLGAKARSRLDRVPPGAPLSPHAVPTDHYSVTKPRRPLVLALALTSAVVVGLAVGLLRWSLGGRLERTEADLAAARATQTTPANTP